MTVTLRPSTAQDVALFFETPLPWRIKGWTGERDGEVLGVGGLAFLPDGTVAAFLRCTDEGRKYAVSLHKAALRVLQDARELGISRLVALAEQDIAPARRWLLRLGFEPMTIDGTEVFLWQNS